LQKIFKKLAKVVEMGVKFNEESVFRVSSTHIPKETRNQMAQDDLTRHFKNKCLPACCQSTFLVLPPNKNPIQKLT